MVEAARPAPLRAAVLASLLLIAAPASAAPPPEPEPTIGEKLAHRIATYVPNRILDLFDIVRLRVRFGSGTASSFRLTRPVSATVGRYSTFYLGLYGPRGEKMVPSPVGFESYDWDDAPRAARDSPEPYYGLGEVGIGFQIPGPGLDVGVEPFEALDFLAGFLLIDLVGDDH